MGNYYDPRGNIGFIKYRLERDEQERVAKERASAKKGRMAIGTSAGVGASSLQKRLFGDSILKRTIPGTDDLLFQYKPPGGMSVMDRIGEALMPSGGVELTEQGREAYTIFSHEPESILGIGRGAGTQTDFLVKKSEIKAITEKLEELGLGNTISGENLMAAGEKLPQGAEKLGRGIKGLGGGLSGAMGAYQVASGAARMFDPDESTEGKIIGGANAVMGANAALAAFGGPNFWNPVGWASLAASAGLTLADFIID